MAETVLPSVRGRERLQVGLVLVGSGTAAGALTGLVMAILLAPLAAIDPWSTATVAVIVAAGVGLDAIRLVAGRPAPPTAGRQVPAEWARWFPARITAALYGARLGVGPLTILSTWTWWSMTVAAGLLGPAAGAATGAVFGLVKLGAVAGVSQAAEPAGHSEVFGRLRRGKRPSRAAITGLSAIGVALTLAATGCGGPVVDADDAAASTTITTTVTDPTVTDPIVTTGQPSAPSEEDRPLIAPADLEDVVRTSIPELDHQPEPAPAPTPAAARPAELGDTLIVAIPDYQPIDEPGADRALDLRAAADLQPDPTEEVALLETRGFRGGWIRAFRNADNDVAIVSVYEFRDATEAEFYLEDGLITIGGYGGSFFDIPDLPGVRGFAQDISRSDGESTEDLVTIGASFHQDDRWYLVYFLGSPERVTPEVLVPTIAAQRDAVSA